MNDGLKRWRITVELELESPDVRIGGAEITEDFIRARTKNELARMTQDTNATMELATAEVSPSFSSWGYRKAEIKSVIQVKNS